MKKKDQNIFVYGTLRRVFNHPLHKLLSENTEYIGEATFRGILYEVGNFPGAIPVNDRERKIIGELYRIKNQDKLIKTLDRYEGYHSYFPAKSLFIRVKRNVLLKTGNAIRAWIYLYNRSVDNLSEIENGDYVTHCGINDSQ